MRITEAAQRLGTSPRMLRYRDMLGLLPPVRESLPGPVRAGSGRAGPRRPRARPRFRDVDLAAAARGESDVGVAPRRFGPPEGGRSGKEDIFPSACRAAHSPRSIA